jgi:hypothetical protein
MVALSRCCVRQVALLSGECKRLLITLTTANFAGRGHESAIRHLAAELALRVQQPIHSHTCDVPRLCWRAGWVVFPCCVSAAGGSMARLLVWVAALFRSSVAPGPLECAGGSASPLVGSGRWPSVLGARARVRASAGFAQARIRHRVGSPSPSRVAWRRPRVSAWAAFAVGSLCGDFCGNFGVGANVRAWRNACS